MNRGAALLAATAAATAVLWLAAGTQESLPEFERGSEDWSGDFRSYYLPNAEFAGARLAAGALPLWNPHQGAGGPFLATLQPGVLYPPNWLHVVLPVQGAFLSLIALHLAAAVVLAGLFARRLGASALGAALAGLAYATSFQVTASIWTPPLVYTAAWLPGVLLAVDRVLERPSARRSVVLAVAFAFPTLAGWPYTVALTALAAVLYAGPLLVASWVRSRALPWRAAVSLAAGALTALLLAAPQLLPSAELLPRSCRALGSIIEEQAVFVPQPHDPRVFLRSTFGRGYNDGVPGYAALVLAPLALLLPGARRARVGLLLAVGAFGLAASFPGSTPVYGWLRELPLLGDFRFPYRYRLLLTFALAITAGVGVGRLERALARWRGAGTAAGVIALAAAVLLGTLPVLRNVSAFALNVDPPVSLADELSEGGVDWQPRDFERVYWTGRSHKLRAPGDTHVVYDMEPLTLARTAELLTYLETGRPLRLLTLKPPKAEKDWVAAPFFGWLTLPATSERAVILDLFSVGTVVTDAPQPWLGERYERVSPPDAPWSVFRNPRALPHAYRVAVAQKEPSELGRALRVLTAKAFDAHRVVLLDSPPPQLLPARHRGVPPAARAVDVTHYGPERVVLRTTGAEPGVVVLTDAFFPGWRATLNGEPVPLLRANLGFRAVAVPKGTHVIEMTYAPESLRAGWLLAALAALGCVGAVALERRNVR